MKRYRNLYILAMALILTAGCQTKQKQMKEELIAFINHHDSLVIPLSREVNLAYWNAAISGTEEDFKKAEKLQLQLIEIYADTVALKQLEKIKISGQVTDTLLARQLDLLYNQFLMAKADTAKLNAIVRMETEIERKYSIFRTELSGKKMTDNDVEEILRTSRDEPAEGSVDGPEKDRTDCSG